MYSQPTLQAEVAKEQELHKMVLQQRQNLKADMDSAVAQESSRAAAARSQVHSLEMQLVSHEQLIVQKLKRST